MRYNDYFIVVDKDSLNEAIHFWSENQAYGHGKLVWQDEAYAKAYLENKLAIVSMTSERWTEYITAQREYDRINALWEDFNMQMMAWENAQNNPENPEKDNAMPPQPAEILPPAPQEKGHPADKFILFVNKCRACELVSLISGVIISGSQEFTAFTELTEPWNQLCDKCAQIMNALLGLGLKFEENGIKVIQYALELLKEEASVPAIEETPKEENNGNDKRQS